METEFIPIGKIEGVHGMQGDVKVRVLSDFPDRLASLSSVFLLSNDSYRECSIARYRPYKRHSLVRFQDIHNANDAKQLEGSILCIRENEMLPLADDSYYIHTLIGCDVFDESQRCLGKLVEVWQLPANDVFVVRNDDGEEILFPAIGDAISCISQKNRSITVRSEFGVT